VIHLKYDKTRWELAPDFAGTLADVLAAPGRVIKESKAKLVSENQVGARSYFIKRYRHFAVPLRPWKYFFKAAQARQEWRLAMRIEQLGIPAVRHVAIGERWSPFGLQESILITEAFDGLPANEVPDLRSRDIVEFVERMANAGVVQRDFHPANLLVRQVVQLNRAIAAKGRNQFPRTVSQREAFVEMPNQPVPPFRRVIEERRQQIEAVRTRGLG
jgi:hypothetical protein